MQKGKKITSGFDRFGKSNPFKVPENYFESFPGRIRERIRKEESAVPSTVERTWRIIRPQLALAAAILGFAVIGYLGYTTFSRLENRITDEEILGYMDYYHPGFGEYYILGMAGEETAGISWSDEYPHTDDPDAFIDYLYLQNIEIEFILSELE